MRELVRFVPKSVLQRGRLTEAARTKSDSIFPVAGQREVRNAAGGVVAHGSDEVLSS
ncbi:hypothetical protein [Bradyrhizobium lablabi]|uniref:hypothetical protein n=1 Tax=Bradyrhizobium lablabi TaxID=722472 RepID=UPI001BA69A47|nr:hypothetical protein [Bradyrhizobium lablabi]MBR0693984.1 hypothetical protein [Bradyrhizobium lablabi]